jgi:hypothetical protein
MHGTDQSLEATMRDGTATEAIARWLEGRYQPGDEQAMLTTIRRETGTDLSDVEIKVIVYDAHDHGSDAPEVLSRLLDAGRREAAPPRSRAPR